LNSPFNETKYNSLLNGLEVSEVNFLELSTIIDYRIEAEFFDKRFLRIEKLFSKIQWKSFFEIANYENGRAYASEEFGTVGGIKVAKIGDVTNRRVISTWETLSINEFTNQNGNWLALNDILMSLTGDPPDVGKVHLMYNITENATWNQRVARVFLLNNQPYFISAKVFFVVLSCCYCREQLERYAKGIRQRNLGSECIEQLKIPIFSKEFQSQIEQLVVESFEQIKNSQELYATAEALLLDGLNLLGDPTLGYTHHNLKDWVDDPIERLLAHNTPTPREEIALLNAERDEILAEAERLKALFDYDAQLAHLEKALPRLETILALVQQALVKERRIEANRNLGHLSIASTQKYSIQMYNQSFGATGRLDAEYYQPKYEAFFNQVTKFEHCKLTELVEIRKSVETGSEAYSTEGIPYIRVSDISKFGIETPTICISNEYYHENETKLNVLKVKQNTILLSKDGSIGIAYKVDKDLEMLTSGALLHLVVKSNKINPDYLTLVLNSVVVQQQAERDGGGSIIVHWRVSEIEKVIIPILSPELQTEIATLVQQSFALQQQSKQLLALAKQAVEVAIEQNEAAALALMAQQQL
jgi:restriction endonuclease S subunit